MGQVQRPPGRTPQHALERGPTPLDEHEGPSAACSLGGEHDPWRPADHTPQVVLDTNVFVGAGFKPRSHSALLLEAVRGGRLRIVWDDATHEEIEHVLRRIPPLSWGSFAEWHVGIERRAFHDEVSPTARTPPYCKWKPGSGPRGVGSHWLRQNAPTPGKGLVAGRSSALES
jgi:hypothetical protein